MHTNTCVHTSFKYLRMYIMQCMCIRMYAPSVHTHHQKFWKYKFVIHVQKAHTHADTYMKPEIHTYILTVSGNSASSVMFPPGHAAECPLLSTCQRDNAERFLTGRSMVPSSCRAEDINSCLNTEYLFLWGHSEHFFHLICSEFFFWVIQTIFFYDSGERHFS